MEILSQSNQCGTLWFLKMHSILDIARETYPEIVTCRLSNIVDEQVLQDSIKFFKDKNRPVLVESDDNESHRRYIKIIEKQYEKFAFTSPGKNNHSRHITNLDCLTRYCCDPTQPTIDHDHDKKYKFLFLVGKPQPYRWKMIQALWKRNLIDKSLISLRNEAEAYTHIIPKSLLLPKEYEWKEINDLGGYRWDMKINSKLDMAWQSYFGKVHPLLYRDTAISIVSEGSIDKGINLVSEKTWIPIVAEHLMVFQASTGHIQFLEELGFNMKYEVFADYDESNHEMVANICSDLDNSSSRSLYDSTRKQRLYNRNLALDEQHWKSYHLNQLKNFNWDRL